MTPRSGPWLHEPGGDNTPQGKLARGCGYLIAMAVGFAILGGVVNALEHWVCDDGSVAWYCRAHKH